MKIVEQLTSSLQLKNPDKYRKLNANKYYDWDDTVYQVFMMSILQKLENRELEGKIDNIADEVLFI